LDDIIEPFLRAIWAAIRFILWEIVFNIIMFNIGRLTLLVITLGKYSGFKHLQKDTEKIALLGIFMVVLAWIALAIYNNVSK